VETYSKHIIQTADGSNSLYVPELDETYHSRHGAVQEAEHVFIKMGLEAHTKKDLVVLEVGLGTFLNASLAWQAAKSGDLKLSYFGLEAYPVEPSLLRQISYFEEGERQELWQLLLDIEWEKEQMLDENFKLFAHKNTVQAFEGAGFDLVFYDAFGPRAQSEMWEEEVFQSLYEKMNKEGILVTYCAKGQVRRNMQAAGFEVERLPGPPGKREMLRARK
jgi:tRNA U34 5-methylaminomethyl-2-thiouridine-forming methyltransferase MnmC